MHIVKILNIITLACSACCSFTSCDVRRSDQLADDNLQRQTRAMQDSTQVQLIDSVYDFGTVTAGKIVEYSFRFKNTGQKPLVIADAHASCGCTVPEKPEQPILPGETGSIKVSFNSKDRTGHQDKIITVQSNARPAFGQLRLTGDVQ